MKKANRIDIVFIISAIITILLGSISLLITKSYTIDIQLHDTYFVFALSHFVGGFLICLAMGAFLYGLLSWAGIKTVRLLSWLHFLLTFQLLIVWLYFFPVIAGGGLSRKDHAINIDEIRYYQRNVAYTTYSFMAFVLGQIGLLLNIVISFSLFYIQQFKHKN